MIGNIFAIAVAAGLIIAGIIYYHKNVGGKR